MFSGWTPRYGGSTGYPTPPPADPGLQSFRDQHLAQLEQLQKMHQRQMESVLPVGAPGSAPAPTPASVPPRPYYPPRQSYPYPPPYSHNVPPPGYQSPALPPDTEKPPPPPPATDQQPPPPPPDSAPSSNNAALEDQQQYWYNQHLLNLQQKAKSHGREAPPPVFETVVPPSAGYVAAPPSQQPPPPPVEEAKPPLPVENVASGINLTEDPEQAQRLKTLQEAAAHWQQHEQHRLGFQYQGIMQKHSAMQQLLQRYQQIVQEPPHLAAMTVDVQLQHYEMQQKQLVPLYQEWENQFKKWQELLQTYPHKDQLQEYQVQWASWQTHIKSTKTHLKDKIASLKSLKQQFGGSHYIGGIAMVPQYPTYSPVMSPAVPTALPTEVSIQPPYTAPVAPVYGPGPPPSLPPATTYSEATPPLPPVTAPPLPPSSSAPPPPPPVSSPSADVLQPPQPPLPPATDTQPPPPVGASAPEPETTLSVPMAASSTSDSTPAAITSSSVMSSAPSTMPPAATDPPVPAGSFIPGNQTLSSGLSYQAQQTMKNVKPPLGQSAPPVPSHNLPSEFPSGLDKQSEHTKFSNPPGLPPVPDQELTPTVPPTPPSMMAGGPYEGPRESRFPAQGHGFAPPHFPPPGSLGFHGYHPTHDKENQHWTNENKDQSTPADPSKQYLETSDHMVPANKWDRPKDNPNQSWERPKPPHVSETEAKEMSDYPPGPVSDRESNYPAEMWNRPDGPQFNKRGSQGDNMGNKWDQPPESRWSTSNEQSSDRRSNFQDRWGVENSTPMDRFGNTQSSGPNRFGGPEVAPYERYGDGMGPPYDQHGAPEIPFQDRFGHPDGSQRFRYNAPDLQARGRARFPSMPPRGRFPFPESHPRHRFGAPEGRPSSFGYPETFSRDHFGGPELPSQDHMGGPEQPLVRDHFGNSEQPPPQEGFRGSEQPPSQERFESPEVSSYQEGFRDPKMPPPRHQFGGSDIPTPQDQFGGPELPQSHNRFGGPDVPDWRKGPGMPPPPVDRFKGSGMPPPPGDRFKGPGMPPPPADRFKGPGMPPPSADRFKGPGMPPAPGDHFRGPGMPPPGDRFRGPETSPHPEDRFRGPEMPPHLGDRFRGSEMPPPPGDRFKGSEMPLTPEDRFKGPEVSPAPGNRFKGPEVSPAPGNRFKGPEVKPATGDNFKGPEMPLPSGDNFRDSEIPPPSGDRFKGPEMPPPAGDPFKGPAMLPSPGDRFGTPEMSSSQQQKRFGDFDGPRRDNWSHADKDNFGAADIPLHDNRDNRVPFSDRWGSGDRKGRPDWPRGRGDGGNRPPLLGDSPLEKSEIQGSTSNVPTKSYQSQFKKHIFKETDVSLSADSFPGDQKDSKKEQQDVEMKQVDEPPKDGAPKKADGSAVQDASKTETSPPSEMHKPVEAADTNKDKTKASDLPKTDPSGDQTLPDLSKVNEPLSASSVHSDASKGTGQIGNTSTSDKREIDLPGLSKPIVTQTSAPEAAKSNVPVPTLSMASKPEEPTDSSRSLGKQDAFQISFPSRSGGLLPTPTTGIVGPFPPYATPPFRPQAPHSMPPVRPGDPWAPPVRAVDPWAAPVRPTGPRGAPIRPGGPRAAPPIRPGGPRAAPPIRPGGPRAAPPIRPGGPRAAFPVRPGGPRADLPIRPGGPRAAPPVRPGGPRGAPPVRMGGPRAPPPVRMGGPRAGHPIRPGAPGGPFSAWEDPLERMDQGEDSDIYDPSRGADPMCEDPYNEEDEEAVMGENYSHGPEGRHGRPEFPEEEDDDAGGYFHNEPGRPGGFREDDASFEPEPFAQDWPENYDVRFDHRGRGRARGFMRGRPPPRPGSREVMDDLDDRGFEPRGHLPEERPSFREGLNEPPPFGREPFPREPRFPDRERFSADPPLEARRRDFALEEGRLDDWERERFWRARELDNLRDPFLDIYMRDERLPLRPPHLPHDIDVRRDPWYDRYLDRDLDRVINHNRLERPYVFELDLDRDFSRIPEDLDLPLRDRERLSARRPLSPHRPYSPVRARSPLPPLPPIERYLDDRWRLDRELSDRDFRDRGELRIREYPERPLWHDDRNPDLLPERSELELKDGRWYPREGRVSEGPNPLEPQLPVDSASGALPEQPGLPGGEPGATGVLALSQRQHEIILKAAQELKMLREQKEQLDNLKNFFGDPEPSNSTGKMAAVQASGKLQQPLPNVPVTGMDPASSTLASSVGGRAIGDQFSDLWEEERRGGHSAGLPVGSKLSGIHQTVDYAHGRELAIGKVEQTPYGERVMLLPEPAMDRGGIPPFQKDFLIDSFDRDFRDRDPYYERMKSADRRDYDRDRLDRDRADHERDRDRHSRDDRSSYRDKDGSSRRSTSDKPPYDRKVDRPGYEVAPPSYGGRGRNFPEERPVIPPPLPVPPPEKKPETKNVDDLLKKPGRESRPDRIVVIMRGLPGSGKTHVAKLIRDKEVEYGGSAPRVLSLDDYFITEVEKVEKDPESGKKIKTKVMDYEYEPEMEETYRSGMLKTFKKTLDDGFFPFIILDSIHDRVRHFEQFWSAAKTKGFEVYLAEITVDTQICGKRNVHGRKLKDINKMFDNWEPAPRHMIRLDIRSLLQDAAIEEVEMEDSEPSVEPQKDEKKEAAEEDDNDRGYLPKSKWEMDTSEAKLDKLDGLKVNKRKRDYESVASRMEDYLQLPDDYDTRESEPGKKRVRWADLEEKKDADRKRAIGFVVGQTDWDKITDKSGHLAERALNRTKYI